MVAGSSRYATPLTLTVELRRAADRPVTELLELAADVGAGLLASRGA